MIRKVITLLSVALFALFPQSQTLAVEQFQATSEISYTLDLEGSAQVTNTIQLENKLSTVYAKSYSLKLSDLVPNNLKAFTQENEEIPIEVVSNQSEHEITLNFPKPVVGKGQKQVFTLQYSLDGLAYKTGEVWEINIPKLISSDFSSYNVRLNVPREFGEEAYITPSPLSASTQDNYNSYLFNLKQISHSGISAGFGKFQVFAFDLTYHLENPVSGSSKSQIALPPDTAFQKVYYTKINPPPVDIKIDQDGNWLAQYNLSSRQRIDIEVEGAAQIFSQPRPFGIPNPEVLQSNLAASNYWQTQDPAITDLAAKYTTPREIYDFVTQTLNYDYNRVRPNIQRLGASQALVSPNNAICMEYTDLFIAIARAAGIPSREVNGYAYSENPEIQPLSLVADVLHAWPEYWDESKNAWIPIDPTWGSTTGGINFFDQLDLRHFAFVAHGQDPDKPYPAGSYKLGENPQKDIYISFGQLPDQKVIAAEVSYTLSPFRPATDRTLSVFIKNNGPSAHENYTLTLNVDGSLNEQTLTVPPYTSRRVDFAIKDGFFGEYTPQSIQLTTPLETYTIPTQIKDVILINLLIGGSAILLLVTIILHKTGKLKIRFNIRETITHK